MFVILDYLQVEIKSKKMPAPLKESMTKRLNENIENIKNIENTVDDSGNVESAINDATMEILLEHAKKTFFGL